MMMRAIGIHDEISGGFFRDGHYLDLTRHSRMTLPYFADIAD